VEKWIPHSYMRRCVARCIKEKYQALFLDPGLGKTSILLRVAKTLIDAGEIKGVLVVVPLRPMYLTWPNEIKKWGNLYQSYTILHSEFGGIEKGINGQQTNIYLINPEGLKKLREVLKGKRATSWPFDMLIVDESTKFKYVNTARFKYLKPMLPKFKRRYIATGTPIPNSLIDIQGQMFIVDQGEAFGGTRSHFTTRFFKRVGRPEWDNWKPNEDTIEGLYRKVAKRSIRLRARDHLTLPKRVNNFISIRLPRKAMREYRRMEDEFYMAWDKDGVMALSSSAARQKCHQIANGCVYKSTNPDAAEQEKREFFIIHEEKIKALQDLIDELQSKPLLIAYRFKHDLWMLKKHIKGLTVFDGGTLKDAAKIESDWNAGKIQTLALYPGTNALGLNLQQSGEDVCYYSMIDDFEAYEQLILRLERQGSTASHIRVHHLIGEDTVDEAIQQAITAKAFNQDRFNRYLEEYRVRIPF